METRDRLISGSIAFGVGVTCAGLVLGAVVIPSGTASAEADLVPAEGDSSSSEPQPPINRDCSQ